ncbi:MAG TPA: LysM peptidoglycan-binding domain-containing protein, partial [Anaerolineae bacterium]|nr:LysM peptidoglycan-binding domain-containing protein [Anaerolineae bacterium]
MRRWGNLKLLGVLLAWMLLAAAPAHAAALNEGSVIHVVEWGETLFSIARRYEVSVDAICAANGISDPTRIYAGQRLVIPTSNVPVAPAAAGATHIVQPGENLYRIALQYGTTVTALAELNHIYNPGHIVASQTLVIPGSPAVPAVAYQPEHAATTHTVQPG